MFFCLPGGLLVRVNYWSQVHDTVYCLLLENAVGKSFGNPTASIENS